MRNRPSALSRRSGDSVFWGGDAFGACCFSGESLDLVKGRQPAAALWRSAENKSRAACAVRRRPMWRTAGSQASRSPLVLPPPANVAIRTMALLRRLRSENRFVRQHGSPLPPPCGGRQVRRQAAHRSSCRRRRTLRFVRWRFFAGFGPRTVSCDSTAARRRPGRRAATHVPLDVPFRSARAETRSDAAPTARRFLAEACTLPAGSLPLPPLDDKSRTASPLPSARPSPLASAAKSIAAARSKDRQRRLLHA